jgi:methylmalonyl-CoA/ethylmalonyl-CoA epimerase
MDSRFVASDAFNACYPSAGLFPNCIGSDMITKIDHLGIAVTSLDEAVPIWENALGLTCQRIEEVPGQKVRTAFFDVAGVHVELLEPTSEDSPIAKAIRTRGEGVHHVAFATNDVANQLNRAKQAGVRLIDETPSVGAGGKLVAFIHPKSLCGVLTELCSDS